MPLNSKERPLSISRPAIPRSAPTEAGVGSAFRERLEDLYRRFAPAVHDRCRRILSVGAEDALHAVFLRIAGSLERVPNEGEVGFWLHRVATNYCLNELRNRQRRHRLLADPAIEELAMADRAAESAEARDFVRRVFADAPASVASAAWLHYVLGLTQKEVGQALGACRTTVIAYLADARKRALSALEQP